MSNILAASESETASAVVRESLIFGVELSLRAAGEVSSSPLLLVTGDGVRERSELATDDGQQSGPVDIGSGEDGDEDADCSVGGGCEVVEHLEVEDDEEEGFGGDDFDDAALG